MTKVQFADRILFYDPSPLPDFFPFDLLLENEDGSKVYAKLIHHTNEVVDLKGRKLGTDLDIVVLDREGNPVVRPPYPQFVTFQGTELTRVRVPGLPTMDGLAFPHQIDPEGNITKEVMYNERPWGGILLDTGEVWRFDGTSDTDRVIVGTVDDLMPREPVAAQK